jgi:hydroxymethylglutaryl-CoA lyase
MGCYEVSLGDTTGAGTPAHVQSLLKYLKGHGVSPDQLAGHFHDTHGKALANVWEAYDCGIRVFDSSVAGLGGCPYAPGAKGNVATEDVVYMFHRAGIRTGVDFDKLFETGRWISDKLSRPTASRVAAAMGLRFSLNVNAPPPLTSVVSPAPPNTSQRRKSLGSGPHTALVSGHDIDGASIHWPGANVKITMNRPRTGTRVDHGSSG